ncbi:tRNA-2-methylthio-N(6)-dimethylallyladenosine synthase [subsurface metagenome]
MKQPSPKVYMWQNNLCITYTLEFKRIEDFFIANKWELTKEPAETDWIVIGACAGFLPQIEDYFKKVKELSPLRKKLVVYGCLPKICPERYAKVASEVVVWVPSERPQDIEKIIPEPAVHWADLPKPTCFRIEDYRCYEADKKYIVLQYGCQAKCVYCPHILGMGPQKSRPRKDILNQVKTVVAQGAHILFLEGMDSGSWGTDLTPPETYPELIGDILEIPGDFEIHVSQFGGNWLLHYGKRLLEAFCDPRITDIKIPLQTTSPRLLKLMGRDPRVEELAPSLQILRKRNRRFNLRTDLIIGFPTETEEELSNTLTFVCKYFDEVACFGFEIHPETPIARMDVPFYDEEVIESRVRWAIEFLRKNPRIITHRGGQVYETLIEREKLKRRLKGTD